MSFWENKSVIVTGGGGFLGSFVTEKLKTKNCKEIIVPRSKKCDLTNINNIVNLYENAKADIVIHLAAAVGGIGANLKSPGMFFYKNAVMGIQLMEQARLFGIKKFITIGTTCCYPKHAPIPFKEEDIWNGYPDEITGYYGLAKRMLLVQSDAYKKEYNFNSLFLLPVNLYGPNDNFEDNSSHVIPALIKRFVRAKIDGLSSVTCWGTGIATREFIYVDDCAEAILLASERYNNVFPVNIGTGIEISIKDLTEMIANIVGYRGEIVWDSTKPEGQPRRCVDTSKAKEYFGFHPKTDIREGLEKTVKWYISSLA